MAELLRLGAIMNMEQEWRKPVPGIGGETRPFWEAARRGQFLIQRCDACHQYQWYPRGFCSNCWSLSIRYVRASGKGTVWTYTVTYQNRTLGFSEEVPYVLALVKLEEGIKVFTNIIHCNPQDVRIGMPVEMTFVPATSQFHVPMFRPAG